MKLDIGKNISSKTGPVALAIAFLGIAVLMLISSLNSGKQTNFLRYDPGPALYPRILLILMVILSLTVIVQSLKLPTERIRLIGVTRVLGLIAMTFVYVIAIQYFGFLIASFLFLALVPLTIGYRRIWVILPVAGIYAVTVWLVFEKALYIILPSSPWLFF